MRHWRLKVNNAPQQKQNTTSDEHAPSDLSVPQVTLSKVCQRMSDLLGSVLISTSLSCMNYVKYEHFTQHWAKVTLLPNLFHRRFIVIEWWMFKLNGK